MQSTVTMAFGAAIMIFITGFLVVLRLLFFVAAGSTLI
jgi:hypothetical protein